MGQFITHGTIFFNINMTLLEMEYVSLKACGMFL